jgi:hypothetical protein
MPVGASASALITGPSTIKARPPASTRVGLQRQP